MCAWGGQAKLQTALNPNTAALLCQRRKTTSQPSVKQLQGAVTVGLNCRRSHCKLPKREAL
jgi:hypothetical protein